MKYSCYILFFIPYSLFGQVMIGFDGTACNPNINNTIYAGCLPLKKVKK